MLTQVWEAPVCWCMLSACVCVSECFLWEPGIDWLSASSTGAHRWLAMSRGPPPAPHFWLRFLSARPVSKGHSVTRSPVISGPDGGPGPESPGLATAGTNCFRLGDLMGCWVPGGAHCGASLCGLASSVSLARAWGSRLPGSPREGSGKGVTWGVKGSNPFQ